MGIAACFLILQYVAYEMSYDQFHGNKDEIYRVALTQYENGELRNASARNFAGINALLRNNLCTPNLFYGDGMALHLPNQD